jgi:hypothetical protein
MKMTVGTIPTAYKDGTIGMDLSSLNGKFTTS